MRELKFRAWDKVEKKMLFDADPFAIHVSGSNEPLLAETHRNEDCIFEQYTGLKDKNGKEIYEGDILREKGLLSLTYLEWDKNHARYQTKVIDESKHVSSIFDFDIIDALECEVVGNIHDNPELIGGKE